MSTTTLVQKQSLLESPLLVIERILRDPEGVWAQISTEFRLNALIGQMLTSSAIALACYGAVLGFSNSPLQALSSAVKLPVLFLLTLAICLPTLYLFNLVFGSRLSVNQTLGLVGVITVIALGAVFLLLRVSSRTNQALHGFVVGYPSDRFPIREVTSSGKLTTLAATQLRLLSIYEQLPAQSELSVWLRAFLQEFREIMDTAYRVAVITRAYGQPTQLEQLVDEVRELERQLADHVVQRLLARDGDAQAELLNGRLATLRLCVRELAGLAEVRVPVVSA